MKRPRFITGLILLLVPDLLLQAQQPSARPLYFLTKDEQWCLYDNERKWADEQEAGALVGKIEYNGNRIARVYVTTPDDPGAGDWAAFDLYTLDAKGNFRSLNRTINVLPGNLSRLENWKITNGKALRGKVVNLDLDTHKPKQEPEDWVPELEVLQSPKELPIWPLAQNAARSLAGTGKACVSVPTPLPAPPPPPTPVKSWSTYVDERFGWSVEYPSTWKVHNSCPAGCQAPGDAVSFSNPVSGNWVIVSSMTDPLRGRNITERLSALRHTNQNPIVKEAPVKIGQLQALTVRYANQELQMESTYLVTESAYFKVSVSSSNWPIEQLPDYPAYRHLLESFKIAGAH